MRSCVEPSLKLAVAVNCCVVPSGIELLCGVTAMEVIVAFVTVTFVLPTIPFSNAVMVEVPGAIALSTPRDVAPLLTVAIEDAEDVHFTAPVTSCVVPSAKVPVAVSCSRVSAANFPLSGVIFRLTSGEEVTSRLLDPLMLPSVAVIVVVPGPLPVADPDEFTVATDEELEFQLAPSVTVCDVPSLNWPVAEY